MNENESVEVLETQKQDMDLEVEPEVDSFESEVKTQKVETPDQRVARLQRELKRAKQKAGIAEEEAEVARSSPKSKSFSLGYSEKAYLNANGIKGTDEYELVKDFASNTGKDLEEIIESRFFQSELKEVRQLRESRAASDAASGSSRGMPSARDTVDYWLAKGDNALPPSYMTQLRRDVVNARSKKYSNTSPFRND